MVGKAARRGAARAHIMAVSGAGNTLTAPARSRKERISSLFGRTVKKYWEIIADNLSASGWSLGYVSTIDSEGRTIWIADAHRDGERFIVRADEKLTAFLELESVTREAT